MVEQNEQRRLAAIFAADMVGYSRLMEADERGTIVRQKTHRAELIDPVIAKHHGRIVKLMGDGMLVEFASVVDAVECAVEIQRAMVAREKYVPEDLRIQYRVGINLGDIIIDGDDLFGDGVNIAARLEGLAEPGGICISRAARDQIRDKLDYPLEDLDEVEVKNIARPVRVFRVLLDRETPSAPIRSRNRVPILPLAGAGMLLAAIAAGAWVWKPWIAQTEPTAIEEAVRKLPDKPSIAVLPFDNLSDDKSQQYFADGMSEDIITDLSKMSGLFVIARNSSFKYRGGGHNLRQVARELGVRYVLEGSVRRVSDRVRINAQLIDATTDGHLWAERYDGAVQDVFTLQDQVTAKIISALAVKLTAGDQVRSARKGTQSVAAHDDFLKGWALYLQTTPDAFAKAIPFLEKAVARDPNYAKAHATLAAIYFSLFSNVWNERFGLTPDDATERALRYLENAKQSSVSTPLTHQVRSSHLLAIRKIDAAIAEADQAIELDSNDPAGYAAKSHALVYAGRPKEALALIEKAMRLDPNFSANELYLRGLAQFGMKDYAGAEISLDRATRLAPQNPQVLNLLVAVYGYLRRADDAAPVIARLKKLAKDRVYRDSYLHLSVKDSRYIEFREKSDIEHYNEGLRRGGLPEFTVEWNFNRADRLEDEDLRRVSFGLTQEGYHPKSKIAFSITRDDAGKFSARGFWNGTGASRIVGPRLCNYWNAYKTEVCTVVYRNPVGNKADGNEFTLIQRSGVFPFAVRE